MAELDALNDVVDEVRAAGAEIVAVSPQIEKHGERVVAKLGLAFPLLRDDFVFGRAVAQNVEQVSSQAERREASDDQADLSDRRCDHGGATAILFDGAPLLLKLLTLSVNAVPFRVDGGLSFSLQLGELPGRGLPRCV